MKVVEVAGVVAIPILIWHFGEIARQELWDVNLLDKFKDVHFDKDKDEARRRLSVYLVRQIKNPNLRQQLRQFIFWDVMERNFALSVPARPFVRDRHDWHLLGDAMTDMKDERDLGREHRDFQHWWCDQKAVVSKRWFSERERKDAIDNLYAYLDDLYFGKDWKDKRSGCARGA